MPTGRDNAERFTSEVINAADKIIIKYGDDWPWMCNGEWRNYVLTSLNPLHMFRDTVFSPPDQSDGWTFVAYRNGSISQLPIANRSLDDPEGL